MESTVGAKSTKAIGRRQSSTAADWLRKVGRQRRPLSADDGNFFFDEEIRHAGRGVAKGENGVRKRRRHVARTSGDFGLSTERTEFRPAEFRRVEKCESVAEVDGGRLLRGYIREVLGSIPGGDRNFFWFLYSHCMYVFDGFKANSQLFVRIENIVEDFYGG